MLLGHPELPVFFSEVITRDYRLHGGFQPIGPVLPYLNDGQWQYIQLRDTTLAAFDEENPMGKRHFPMMMVRKDDVVALSLLDEDAARTVKVLTTKHSMIVYTPRFVIKGDIHMHEDDIPLALFSSGTHDFVSVTNTSLYPLKRLQHAPSANRHITFLNRKNVNLYLVADD
jgi:hypothetical protein